MLEASYFDALHMVSPFTGGIVVRFCDLSYGAITQVFTSYVDKLIMVFRKDKKPGWTEIEFQELSLKTKKLTAGPQDVFSEYQRSRLRTIKSRFMDNLFHDLRAVGHIGYLHASLYEEAQNSLKYSTDRPPTVPAL